MQEVISRTDLKVDLLQELERQRQAIEAYRDMPDVSSEALDAALRELLAMTRSRQSDQWDHTAAIMALYINSNRGKHSRQEP